MLPVGRFSRPIGLVSIRSCGKILEFAGCGFLGYFLFKAAGFWAVFLGSVVPVGYIFSEHVSMLIYI